MEYLFAGVEYIGNLGIAEFVLVPFLIWLTAECFWVGFFFPLVEALRDRAVRGDKVEKGRRYVWKIGFHRILHYKWEIFFSSLNGILIMDIYHMVLVLTDEFLPSFMYVIILSTSSLLFGTLLFAKGNSIMSEASPSLAGSIKYLLGGFQNPFKKSEISEMREVVKRVNEGLRT